MENIRTMECLEHIRLRASMYIGRIGNGDSPCDGIYTILKEIIMNSIDEHQAGCGESIVLDIQDNRVKVRDFGRGIPFNKVFRASTDPMMGGRYDSVEYKKTVGLNGLGLKVTNALSKHFMITSYRSGEYMSLTFSKGDLIRSDKGQTSERDGLYVEFVPDSEILNEYAFRMDILKDIVNEYCCLHKGLAITLNGVEFISKNGLLDMLDNTCNSAYRYPPIHICDERFEIVFTHISDSEEFIRSYVNDHHTKDGGTHHDAFHEALSYALSRCFNKKITTKQCTLGLVAIIKVNIQWPIFANAGKDILGSRHMWYDAEGNHGPTIYETFKKAFLKAISDNGDVLTELEAIWERFE